MKNFVILMIIFSIGSFTVQAQQDMDQMWGNSQASVQKRSDGKQMQRFEQGNYAMFIHWGLFSQLGNRWKGQTYYGVGEWLMNKNMANIPVKEYMDVAKYFNPKDFDARDIAQLAKDAGMKYIIVTSKHHDGFAMYDSKACDFNIVKQTPFGRDPMKELAEACREFDLGFGFYYSHNQDWTYPGGNGGPQKDSRGNIKNFEDYFNEKCLPQVEEITRNYGELELIWFDTPGNMPSKYAKKIVEVVRANQPNALVSGRVGYNMGDYQTLGDMEIPLENIDGIWESIDVTNDAWGYAWYDQNWKTPKQVLSNLISTVGRGGTYMMNVGPDFSGRIPKQAQMSLRTVGRWIARYPEIIYGAGPSPWKHGLPWGDVTTNNESLYLAIYSWPTTGKLYVPGILTGIDEVKLLNGKKEQKLKYVKEGNWLVIDLPVMMPDSLISVIRLMPARKTELKVDSTLAVDPEFGLSASTLFATVQRGKCYKRRWMEKFGEWKVASVVENWKDDTSVIWEVEIKTPGMYQVDLTYTGNSRIVWSVENEEGISIQNQQNSSTVYSTYPIGWLEFKKAGKHKLTVRMLEGKKASLASIGIQPIIF